MCYSRVRVFYGVFVRSSDLLYAAMAWENLQAPLLVLDMIGARRTSGTLKISGRSRIIDVPIEVWDLVKRELVKLELCDARTTFVQELLCGDCWREGGSRAPLDLYELIDCDSCCDKIADSDGARGGLQRYDTARPFSFSLSPHPSSV